MKISNHDRKAAEAAEKFADRAILSQGALHRRVFAWLAAMNYLERHPEEIDFLSELAPTTVFHSFVQERFQGFGLGEQDLTNFWTSLALEDTIYTEQRFQSTVDTPEKRLNLFIFGGFLAEDAKETIALGSSSTMNGGGLDLKCSGVLIGKNIALSACHCLEANVAIAGSDVQAAGALADVEDYKMHDHLDLALLFLNWRTDPSYHIRIANPAKENATNKANAVEIYGYGLTESGEIGRRRGAVVTVQESHCSGGVNQNGCLAGEMLTSTPAKDTGACNLDSGGPVFILDKQGQRFLAAVHKFVPFEKSRRKCGDATIHVRVDLVWDWITKAISSWRN